MYLYETHIEVSDLDRSIAFYESLGLKLGLRGEFTAFFYVGDNREHMVGLWLVDDGPIHPNHFAFHVDMEFLLQSGDFLKERGIEFTLFHKREPIEPIVFPWMPAAAVYFLDPDGNKLEYITLLPDEPEKHEGGPVPYLSEWQNRANRKS